MEGLGYGFKVNLKGKRGRAGRGREGGGRGGTGKGNGMKKHFYKELIIVASLSLKDRCGGR